MSRTEMLQNLALPVLLLHNLHNRHPEAVFAFR